MKRDWGGPERVAGNGFGEQIERILVSLFLDTMSTKGQRILTPYDDLTYQIIGCAMAVHRKLGPGYREDTYQRDLQVYLAEKNISFEAQKLHEVYDSLQGDVLIGYYIPDFVVDDSIIIEIKALKGVDNSHIAQVIGYLAVTGCSIGLLINFGLRSLQYRRILPPKNILEHKVNRQWLFVPDWLMLNGTKPKEK